MELQRSKEAIKNGRLSLTLKAMKNVLPRGFNGGNFLIVVKV
jgi:hypothetical protein